MSEFETVEFRISPAISLIAQGVARLAFDSKYHVIDGPREDMRVTAQEPVLDELVVASCGLWVAEGRARGNSEVSEEPDTLEATIPAELAASMSDSGSEAQDPYATAIEYWLGHEQNKEHTRRYAQMFSFLSSFDPTK